ncbi:MAG: SMC-Scp complex subunit ScpB, partial [Henriciella sp.]
MNAIPQLKTDLMDDEPEDIRNAVKQLSFAYRRSAETLSDANDVGIDASSEALRRAEAILFAAGEPLSAEQIAEVLPQEADAAQVLMSLKAAYANRGVNLVEVAGKWRFQTAEDLSYLFVEERHEQKKLSQAALETLAIIAYGQPVTRAEIEAVRGVAVSKGTIDQLMEAGWVRIKGRRKTP